MTKTYACPKCGSTDLRAEVPATVTLLPDGTCQLEDFEAVCSDVGALTVDAFSGTNTLCNDCEYEAFLPAFIVQQAHPAP